MDGSCRFGDDKCWYAHKSSLHIKQTENLNQDPELINRLVTIMEKFTERIEFIETNSSRIGRTFGQNFGSLPNIERKGSSADRICFAVYTYAYNSDSVIVSVLSNLELDPVVIYYIRIRETTV